MTADFADAMNAVAQVVVCAQRWRDTYGTDERYDAGHALLDALERLDAIDRERGVQVFPNGEHSVLEHRKCSRCGGGQFLVAGRWTHTFAADEKTCPIQGDNA